MGSAGKGERRRGAMGEGGITRGVVQLTPNRTLHRDGAVVKASAALVKASAAYAKQVHARKSTCTYARAHPHVTRGAHTAQVIHVYTRTRARARVSIGAAASGCINREDGVTSRVLNTVPEVLRTIRKCVKIIYRRMT